MWKDNDYTIKNALLKGGFSTNLSFVVMGFGNITNKQIIKGLIYLAWQVAYILFMINYGVDYLKDLFSLGGEQQQEVWNEAKGIYEYTAGDNTLLMLLYGIAVIFLTIGFAILWRTSVKSAYKAHILCKEYKHINTFTEDIKSLFDENLHTLLLSLPVMGIIIFNILPLIFMITMAFTNYSKTDDHLVLFNWTGLVNFAKVLNMNNTIGQTFWSVLGWTLVWAIFATGLNYFLGMLLAMIINRKTTKFKSFWRFCFVLSIAIPQFVSLLIMRTMLKPEGAINVLLKNAGILSSPLPFLTNATWARVVVIVINLWVGIPFTMLQVTGILQNIPAELYEAAKIDGANKIKIFFKITLPYMLFVTTPYLITTFAGNVNNFNVIFLLTAGDPVPVGSTAGKTDLLVTWLYKLTIDKQYYNYGAVIGILTFIVLAVISLTVYRNTGSYKDEEGFQ